MHGESIRVYELFIMTLAAKAFYALVPPITPTVASSHLCMLIFIIYNRQAFQWPPGETLTSLT